MKLINDYRTALTKAIKVAREYGWSIEAIQSVCSEGYTPLDKDETHDAEDLEALNSVYEAWRQLFNAERDALASVFNH